MSMSSMHRGHCSVFCGQGGEVRWVEVLDVWAQLVKDRQEKLHAVAACKARTFSGAAYVVLAGTGMWWETGLATTLPPRACVRSVAPFCQLQRSAGTGDSPQQINCHEPRPRPRATINAANAVSYSSYCS